jgi:hypothetical protein
MYERPETGEILWEIVQSIYNIDDITGINFTETWYLDINTFSIKKVVNSINLVLRYERQEEVEGFGYAYKKYFTIQLKNPVQGQNNFFFNKNAFLITENLYSLNNFIYKNNGEKFLPDTFAYIDNNFSNNALIVGKKFIEENNYFGEHPVILYGLIDKQAKKILPLKYNKIKIINNDFLIKKIGTSGEHEIMKYNMYWLIDNKAKKIYNEKFSSFKLLPNNKAIINLFNDTIVYDGMPKVIGKYGVIDLKGGYLIPAVYDEIVYDNNAYKVKLNGKYGFINKEGSEVIPLKYDDAIRNFENGRARVKLNGEWFYINTKGERVE